MLLDRLSQCKFKPDQKIARHLFSKAIALLTTLQLSACLNNVEVQKNTGYLTSITNINSNIDQLMGQTINVRNDVLEIIDARGLILDSDRLLQGKSILVIGLNEFPSFDVTLTPEILVTGEVWRLNFENLEKNYSLYLDRNLYAKYEGQPIIIANSSILSPDPEDLNKNPQKYYDKRLAIAGEVEDLADYGVFELDEESVFGGEDLLIIHTKPYIKLNNGQNVLVFGVLKPKAIDELEQNYPLDWNQSTKQQFKTKYPQRSVFMAERIQSLE